MLHCHCSGIGLFDHWLECNGYVRSTMPTGPFSRRCWKPIGGGRSMRAGRNAARLPALKKLSVDAAFAHASRSSERTNRRMQIWPRAASPACGCCTITWTSRTRSARGSTRHPAVSGTRSCTAAKATSQTPSIGSATSASIRCSTRSASARPSWLPTRGEEPIVKKLIDERRMGSVCVRRFVPGGRPRPVRMPATCASTSSRPSGSCCSTTVTAASPSA